MARSTRDTDEVQIDVLETDVLASESLRPSAALRERLIATAHPDTRLEGFADRLAVFLDLATERARELLRSVARVRGADWVDDQVAGVRLLHFEGGPRLAEADCGLVHLDPGIRYPRHRHGGYEWAFVLSGAAVEEGTGRVWLPGDIVLSPADSAHAYRARGDEPFVFAVVLGNGVELLER